MDIYDESEIRERSLLYDRLLDKDEFRQDCKNRWIELREVILSKDNIFDTIDDIYEEIKDILKIEMRMWKPKIVKEKPAEIYNVNYHSQMYSELCISYGLCVLMCRRKL